MNTSFLLIAAITLITLGQPIQKGHGDTDPQQNREIGTQSAPPSISPVSTNNSQPESNENKGVSPNKTYDWREAVAPQTLSNWALVLVGIGAIIAAWRTFGALKKQTADTKTAADAALLNAQAVIDAERPWLLVPLGKEFSEIEEPCLIARLPGEYRISCCTFRVKNFGRSPAKVVETKWGLFTGVDRESIPDVAAYDSRDASLEDYTFPQDTITPLQATFEPDGRLTSQEVEEIMVKRTRFLWLRIPEIQGASQ